MRYHLLALAIAALFPAVSSAQVKTVADDDDLNFEESIRSFGFISVLPTNVCLRLIVVRTIAKS